MLRNLRALNLRHIRQTDAANWNLEEAQVRSEGWVDLG